MSRLFQSKPLIAALGVVFSGNIYAGADGLPPQSAFVCPDNQGAARYLPARGSGGGALPEQATRISADRVEGQTNVRVEAQGDVIVEHGGDTLNAEQVSYDQRSNTVSTAGGFVLIDSQGGTVRGENLHYRLDEGSGSVSAAEFATEREGRRLQGSSGEMLMQDKNRAQMKNVRFNTCAAGDNSWYIQAASLDADRNRNIGVARHARLVFGGVPLLYTPWADFPLSGNRKSGFLVPGIKVGSNGTEMELPYYFNLAPNLDATLAPGVISARGATIGGEVRYLEKNFSGSLNGKYMPHDRKSRYGNRYETKWLHQHRFNEKLSGGLHFHQVSDDDYYRDFYGRNDVAENVQLERRAWLNYRTRFWDAPLEADLELRKYQTLSDALGRKERPYALLPRLSAQWQKYSGKTRLQAAAQFSRFTHPDKQSGSRAVLYPSISWDFANRWAYVRPKLGVHATHYRLDRFDGKAARNASRILPIANVEAGATFERESRLFGGRYLQTLEPRLFYNYIPKKSQNDLPNFDSSENSFSYNQLFRENLYSGHDRINSSNSLAGGLQTRIIDRQTGAERFRAGIGQKFYFNTDNVLLDGQLNRSPRRKSDIAAFAGGRIHANWFADAHIHYDQNQKTTRRADIGVRYNPQAGKVLSLRHKYGRDEEIYTGHYGRLRQMDFAFQWPLNNNLYALGRFNYSIRPRTALEQMLGLEYRSSCGCWSAGMVAQRYISTPGRHKHAVFLSFQLKDLSSIGSNPYHILRLGIPGYHKTNEVIKK